MSSRFPQGPFTAWRCLEMEKCWLGGANAGAFGDGTTTSSTLPVVALASNVWSMSASISSGSDLNHSVFIKRDSIVSATGANPHGELGNGTNNASNTPVQVSNLAHVYIGTFLPQIAAGSSHSVAAVRDGTAWAWGFNNVGQLGNGTQTDSNTPVQVSGLQGVVSVAAGFEHSLAIVAPTVSIENERLDFGFVGTGTSSAERVATIHNQGPGPLAITSIYFACSISNPGFVTTAPSLPLTLASGEATSVSVKFFPETSGQVSACIAVLDNGFHDGDRGLQVIHLEAVGDPFADIVLSGTTSPVAAVPGDTIVYGMTITNAGPASQPR